MKCASAGSVHRFDGQRDLEKYVVSLLQLEQGLRRIKNMSLRSNVLGECEASTVLLGQHLSTPCTDIINFFFAHRVRHHVLMPFDRMAELLQQIA